MATSQGSGTAFRFNEQAARNAGSRAGQTSQAVEVHDGPADAGERERNRKLLKTLAEDYNKLAQSHLQMQQDHKLMQDDHQKLLQDHTQVQGDLSQMRGLQSEVATLKAQLQDLRARMPAPGPSEERVSQLLAASSQELRQDVSRLAAQQAERAQAMSQLQAEQAKLKTEQAQALAEAKQKVNEINEMRRQTDRLAKSADEMKDLRRQADRLAKSVDELKGAGRDKSAELERLRKGLHSQDEVQRVKSMAEITSLEFHSLRKAIFDRGILAPPREDPPCEENPPVGTIELSDDVFTARLLLKLGFLKAKLDKRVSAGHAEGGRLLPPGSGDSDSDGQTSLAPSELEIVEQFDNVTGIVPPEVEEGGGAYCNITIGWLLVCIATLFFQLFIVALLLKTYATDLSCFPEGEAPAPYQALDWWLLHVTRAFAMLIGGGYMVKDLMDTANYCMVSYILEPHASLEVMVSAFLRIVLIVTTLGANVFLLLSEKTPGLIWMNMAALRFISGLGCDILVIAKRGVFGHHICKAVTGVSFELTFMHDYPRWFPYVSCATQVASFFFVGVATCTAFLMADNECE